MHLNRRDLDCHPNLRHQTIVFAITPNVLLFQHRDSRMTPVYVISDISGWRDYYASEVSCFRTFSSRRWYSDQFLCKNTRISLRYDETRTKNVKLLPPALNRAKAQHACVLRPPERGGAGCQFLIKTPMTGTPPSTCLG